MKVLTSSLIGRGLDWAVAKCKTDHAYFRHQIISRPESYVYHPSTIWAQGGPIIEAEKICLDAGDGSYKGDQMWEAHLARNAPVWSKDEITGPTPLSAAMRCYVASKLGDEIDIPDELT